MDGGRDARPEDSERREALVVSLAQSFSERHRRGERPTLDEYVARHPELEAEIREMFPLLCLLEDLGPEAPGRTACPGDAEALRQLGEYRIVREIGRGGMGVVYEAEQQSLKRRVALKALPFQAFQEKHQLERFHREAQAAARLHHANIVPVFGVGEDRGVHYYVMQFIRGQTLAQVLQEVRRLRVEEGAADAAAYEGDGFSAATAARALVDVHGAAAGGNPSSGAGPSDGSTISLGGDSRAVFFRRAARIALEAAEALAYAHNEGVLHRDIKPSNLLLDVKGTLWITDFGLAKMEGSGELTQAGALVGTIRYMAPERFRGAGDPRSDVYSLGITLYELLTLRPAFPASDRAEVMSDVMNREPLAPRRLDPAIPRDLETVVLKAIAKEPAHRYPSAASLADDLRRFIDREPVSARRAGPLGRLRRWAQRNPALAASSALTLLLLFALAAGGIVSSAWQRAALDQARAGLIQAKLEEGRAWRLSREPGGRTRSLIALREAVTPGTSARVRNEIIGALALVDLEETYRRDVSRKGDHISVDALLSRFALRLPGGAIRIHEDVECKFPVADLPGEGRSEDHASLSPGGAYLASEVRGEALVLWDVAEERRLFEAGIPPHQFRAAFDEKGERFAFLHRDGSIRILSLPGGKELRRLDERGAPTSLSFGPGGRRLAGSGFGFNRSSVLIFDVETGNAEARLHHAHDTHSIAWHPGGRRLAVACHDFKVHVWDVEAATRRMSLEGHSAEVHHVAFSHAGRFLASAGWDNRTLLWDAATGDLITEAHGQFTAFSRDDRLLGFHQGMQQGNLWRVNGGECYRTLDVRLSTKGPFKLAISADGSWLAVAALAGGVHLWSLASPDEPHRLEAGIVWSAQFQPDGAALWTAASEGLFRWAISGGADGAGWSFGPPLRIGEEPVSHVSISRHAPRLVTAVDTREKHNVFVRDLDRGFAVTASWRHDMANRCEISSSGSWVISTTFGGNDVQVRDASTGSLAHTFEVGAALGCFSPDERCLALSLGSWIAVYELGSWRERFKIPKVAADQTGGPLTFTADSRFLAAALSRSLVALFRAEDGGEVARFEAPTDAVQISHLSLDDDQRFLAAASTTNRVLLWDLRALRLELQALGLDWRPDQPLPAPLAAKPSRVRVDAGSLGGGDPALLVNVRRNRILDSYSRRIELEPSPDAYSARASAFEGVGDWASALADLERALEAAPGDGELLARRAALQDLIGGLAGDEVEHGLVQPILLAELRERARRGSLNIGTAPAAMADWKRVLELAPGDAEATAQMAWLWIVERCAAPAPEPAGEVARLLLASAGANYLHDPNGMHARNLGAILYHLGRLGEAKPILEDAWRMDPRLFSARLHLAMIEHRLGNAAEARRLLEETAAQGRKRLAEGDSMRPFFETILAGAQKVLAQPVVAER